MYRLSREEIPEKGGKFTHNYNICFTLICLATFGDFFATFWYFCGNVWEKYKTSDESVICMVGIISLCVSLCKADGKFDESEFNMILSLIPHMEEERDFLIKLIKEIDDNNS